MEESADMTSGDDKTHFGKTKKRTIKTPAQVEALEKFYDDHKYPSESMKSQLAEAIGLTEKQVSGWFCHRRLKDKRLSSGEVFLNGKKERSSGVIQDRGSGFRQDSCGSTKQGDDRTSDPREVESRRLNGAEFSTPDLTHDFGGHLARNHNGMDDTSLGSNSSLRNTHVPHNAESFDEGNSRCLTNSCPADMPVKPRTGPSGYLKVKGHVENAAIIAVKRQLGRQHREDGPPLGVEFEPLPPGAFESSVQNDSNNLYHAVEHEAAQSGDFSKVHRQPNSSTAYEYYSKISSHNLGTSSERFKRVHGTDGQGKYADQKFRKKTGLLIPEYPVSARNSQGEEDEGPPREMSFNSRDNHKLMAKHNEKMRMDHVSNQCVSPNRGRVIGDQAEQWSKRNFEASFKVSQVQYSDFKPSSVHNQVGIYHNVREKGISRSVKKDVKRISNHMSNSPEFARNVQFIGMPIQTIHQGGRSTVETTSSSSEEDDSSTENSSFEE